jgi:uncharacterized protein
MNKQNLQELIKTEEYSFLRTNDKINKNNICLLTLGGSHAYGTSNPDSDIDIRGIYSHTRAEILSMNCADKPIVHTATDTTIYPIKQIIKLLSNCNPNTLEILGTKEEHLIQINKIGRLLRDNSNIFLSQIATHSFGGYATAQLRRLQNALARDSYSQAEKEKHILGSIKNQNPHIQRNYSAFDDKDIKLYLDDSDKTDFDKEVFIDINLQHYPLRDLKAIVNEWLNVIKDYDSLNHRNSKKDDIHLNKHVMHIIRLLLMGAEILEGKGINTYRENDLELLMALRNGDYVREGNDYSYIFDLIDKYEDRFNYAKKHTELPIKPDYDKINELVIEVNREVLDNE